MTVMVVAYLPNEADVIKDTLANLLDEVDLPGRGAAGAAGLQHARHAARRVGAAGWAAREPRLDVLRVEDSTSKAENVMAALASVRGEIVGILDADHQLRPDAAQLASRWINAGYDVVQGRCVVRNARENLLTRIIAFEFETIYGVAHAGRSLLLDTGIFGGANGWWRTSTLRTIGLDHRMLTEDIDSSLRALLAGYRIVHERDVVSTELAPTTLRAWWKQRTRWSQGWFQVTLRHGAAIRRTKALRGPARLYWTALLSWREAFPIVSVQLFSVLAASVLLGQSIRPKTDPFLLWTTAITLMSGLIIGAGAGACAAANSPPNSAGGAPPRPPDDLAVHPAQERRRDRRHGARTARRPPLDGDQPHGPAHHAADAAGLPRSHSQRLMLRSTTLLPLPILGAALTLACTQSAAAATVPFVEPGADAPRLTGATDREQFDVRIPTRWDATRLRLRLSITVRRSSRPAPSFA